MNIKDSNAKVRQNFQHANLEFDTNKILFAPNDEGIICYEEFKNIPTYEGYFQVSNFGRVKSLERKSERLYRNFTVKEKILSQNMQNGYLRINLLKNNKRKGFQTHQLVAIVFLNHKPNGYKSVVDHIDNNPLNNNLNNLQIITNRHNSTKDKKGGTSKYIGVSWKSSRNKWRAAIYHNGKDIHLGFFDDEKLAATYYQNALKAINKGEEIVIKRKTNTSKYTGIYKKGNRWAVQHNNAYMGTFSTEEEAFAFKQTLL